MPRPVVGDLTERLYASLPAFYRAADEADPTGDYPLLRWLSLVGDQADEAEVILDRIDVVLPDEGGAAGDVSELVDPALADAAWLDWLAQHVGVRLPAAMPTAQRRDVIADAATGWRSGTRIAIEAAARATLTGTRQVDVMAHYGGDPWVIAVRTIPTETPDSAATLAAILDAPAKPAGYDLVHVAYSATWDVIEAEYPTWTLLEAAGSWDAIESTV